MSKRKHKTAGARIAPADNLSPTHIQPEQLLQIFREDYGFADILRRFKQKEYAHMATITICQSPLALALVGGDTALDLVINPSTLVKCMASPETKYHGHELEEDILKYLVFELRNPAMVFKGSKEGSFVFVTDLKDKVGRPVIVITALNRLNGRRPVNQVTSAYGRERFPFYVERQIKNGNLVAINKNKANQIFQSLGHDWPIEEIPISFDNSIAYTLENVKGLSEKTLNKSQDFMPNDMDNPQTEKKPESRDNHLDVLRRLLVENENVVDMIRFFEYAGSDIYSSLLWQQFQQDKDFLSDSDVALKLQDVLQDAQHTRERPENKVQKQHDYDRELS